MARTPVNWDPYRYGSVKHVLKFDAATGTYSLQEQSQSYNGINYNFASLSSGNTTTNTNTSNTNTQTQNTTSAQTTEAFGNVMPLYAQANEDPLKAEFSKGTATDANTVGFNVDNNKNSFYDNLSDAEKNAIATGTSGMTFKGAETTKQVGPHTVDTTKTYDTPRTIADQNKYLGRTFTEKPTGLLSNVKSKLGDVKSRMIDPAIKTAKSVFKTPAMMMIDAIVGEETDTQKHAKTYFTAYTSGSMAGRITGDDGKYDPANNLYHGMNRVSAYGNLEQAGQKRIDRIEKTLAKWEANPTKYADKLKNTTLYNRKEKFEKQQNDYRKEKNKNLVDKAVKKGASIHNPNEMRAATGGDNKSDSGKSIICTQMYQQTQLEDWKKTMRLWYIFQKKYLTMEHQEGYHFLFKPFVNGMKKSKALTALGKHCAIARTNDIKHIMFGTPFSLSGILVRLVTEPICYITGKIKSWL